MAVNRTMWSARRPRFGSVGTWTAGRRPPVSLLAGGLLAAGVLLAACGQAGRPNPSGTLEATAVDLAPALTGRVLAVGAGEGQPVAAGDTLLVLDTELLALQRAETAARLAGLAAQERAAEEEQGQAARRFELDETRLQRLRALRAQGSATEQEVDDAAARRDVSASQARAAQHRIAYHRAEGDRLRAALAVYDRQLADGFLRAPRAGTILVRAIEPGEMAGPTRVALRLADLTALELRVYLEAPDLDQVRLGERLPVRVDALPDQELEGTVAWISAEAEFTPKNVQTRNARAQLVYAVKLRIANPDGRLHIGMPAEVRLTGRPGTGA